MELVLVRHALPVRVDGTHDGSPADPRITHVDSLVDVDPRMTLEQYQLLYRADGRPPDAPVVPGDVLLLADAIPKGRVRPSR